MKISVIGAAGKAGAKIAEGAQARGWEVRSLLRNAAGREVTAGTAVECDATDVAQTAAAIEGSDVVVLAAGPVPGDVDSLAALVASVAEAMTSANVSRLVVVGGAGSLVTPDGAQLMESPSFPAAALPTAQAHGRALEALRGLDRAIDWLYLSPAARFLPDGEARGKFQLGEHALLVGENGESAISYADYASALLDQVSAPAAHRDRISVAWR